MMLSRFNQKDEPDRLQLSFLVEFNTRLEENAKLSRLNERFLEGKMMELDRFCPVRGAAFFQTWARIHELLLLCAANYANNCEFRAVGDLLFNPRLVLVHLPGFRAAVKKVRHTPLSEQFTDKAKARAGVIEWLKNETALEIKKKSLVPHSLEILESSGFISGEYLASARNREAEIADLSVHLCCQGFEDRLSVENWMRAASQSDRDLMNSKFIVLDWKTFWELGVSVRLLARGQRPHGALPSVEEHVAGGEPSRSAIATS